MKSQTIAFRDINLGTIEFIGVGLGWWGFGQGSTSSPWGEKFTRPRISKEYKEWVNRQCEYNLDSSLTNKEFTYKELDEKFMLG